MEYIKLQDLFKEGYDYKNIINKNIISQIEQLVIDDPQNKGIYEFSSIKENQKFYIQDDNIVIYFDLYDIAPYAAGIPKFKINIKNINHILKEEYLDVFN